MCICRGLYSIPQRSWELNSRLEKRRNIPRARDIRRLSHLYHIWAGDGQLDPGNPLLYDRPSTDPKRID